MTYLKTLNRNTQGILCLVAALAFLTVSDSIIKWLSAGLPLHEIMLFRGLFAMILVFIFIHLEGGLKTLKTRRPLLHFVRGSMLVLANMFFFLGLAVMPLAETVSLFYTAPLFICILSQPVLGERVGLSRWLVIFAGLVGVIIMLRPGSEVFRSISLLPVLAALSYAVMTMMTRKLGMHEKASALTFYIQLAFIVISSIVGLAIGDGRFDTYHSEAIGFLLRAWELAQPGPTATTPVMWSHGIVWGLPDFTGLSFRGSRGGGTFRICLPAFRTDGWLLPVGRLARLDFLYRQRLDYFQRAAGFLSREPCA